MSDKPLTNEELDAMYEMADTVAVKGRALRKVIDDLRAANRVLESRGRTLDGKRIAECDHLYAVVDGRVEFWNWPCVELCYSTHDGAVADLESAKRSVKE